MRSYRCLVHSGEKKTLPPLTHDFVFCHAQGAYGNGTSKSYELKLGNFLRIGSVGVVVSEIHTGAGGEHKCLSWEELTCLKGDIAAIQKACETSCCSLCCVHLSLRCNLSLLSAPVSATCTLLFVFCPAKADTGRVFPGRD